MVKDETGVVVINFRFFLKMLTLQCDVWLRDISSRSFVILFALLFLACGSNAQFNDSTHYYSSLNSTGSINKTNAGTATVLSELMKFSMRRKTVAFNTINSYIYGHSAGAETNNDFSSATDFDYWRAYSKFYYWGLGTFDKSFSLKINHRLQGGVGIGYTLANNKNIVIVLSDGIIYERADLTDAELGRRNYDDFRNSLRIKYHWVIAGIMVLDGNGFWQPSLSDSRDVVWKNTTTLAVRLKKWLSLTTAITYNDITITHRQNLLLTFGLTTEKYF